MYESLAVYIDGEFIAGGGRLDHDVHNPASRKAIGRLPHAGTEDLDRAIAAAQRAFEPGRHSRRPQRTNVACGAKRPGWPRSSP